MRRAVGVALALLATSSLAPARAAAEPGLVTSSGSARTLPRHRFEVGLFQPLRYGLLEDLELATQPLLLWSPEVEAKARWWQRAPYAFATRGRISYPTPLLRVLAKEGALGLLPADSRVPHAVVLEVDALATAEWSREQLWTVFVGASVAPRGSDAGMPLLDFPFLYARFAVLKTTAVYRVGFDYDAMLGERFRLAADLKWFVLPAIDGGFSFEPGLSLRWLFARHWALEAGARFEYAKFPAGLQFHYLPFVDVLFAF